jgi:Protein of unknown function (DUF3644)
MVELPQCRNANDDLVPLLRSWSKGREAMLTAVQIFNNLQVEFKSELFIVTTTIAWTYLLHACYRKKGIEYRRFHEGPQRRRFIKTRHGAVWHWSLEECLDCDDCPIEPIVIKNLKFLIGIRHEIEHQMTTRIDDQLSAKFQAAALNFNLTIKKVFVARYSLDTEQACSIQFSSDCAGRGEGASGAAGSAAKYPVLHCAV